MDQRLFNAARLGDIVTLDALEEQDPMILERVSLAPVPENPLHVAALAGQTGFVREMVKRMPSFAWELNKDGFSPLHMASARGHIHVVRELLTAVSLDLCLLRDKNGLTPFHCAVIQGRIVVIRELLAQCPQAFEEVTARGETALHLAVKNNRFEVLKILVHFLNNNHHQELILAMDFEGNNISDLAQASNQLPVLHLLHGEDDTSKGGGGQEAVGHTEGNLEIEEVSDGQPSRASPNDKSNRSNPNDDDDLIRISDEFKNVLLVLAVLIATVTYQAGLAPPPSIWKEGMSMNFNCTFRIGKQFFPYSCPAYRFYVFMSSNTAGFMSSIFLIFSALFKWTDMTVGLLVSALLSTMFTYVTLLVTLSSNPYSYIVICFTALGIIAICMKITLQILKSLRNEQKTGADRVTASRDGTLVEPPLEHVSSEDV